LRSHERCGSIFAFGHGEEDVEKSTTKAQAAPAGLINPISAANGTGSALFVINLCASIAPVRLDGNNIPGLENYRLYQVARVEDGRTRHRLRLGFFTSESHADSVLTVVRQQYPTAFTSCLCEEDRRFARGYLPQTQAAPRPVAVSNHVSTAPPKAPAAVKHATTVPAAKPAPAAHNGAAHAKAPAASNGVSKPIAAKPAADFEVIELTWEPETPKAQPQVASTGSTQKQRALSAADGLDEFTWEPPSLTPAASAVIAKSTSDTAKHSILKAAPKAPPVLKAPPAAKAPPVAKPPAAPAKPAVSAPPSKPDPGSSMRLRALELSVSEPPPPPPAAKRTTAAEPFHVGKGVQFADSGITLQAEPVVAKGPAAKRAEPVVAKPAPATKPTAPAAQSSMQKAVEKPVKPLHAPAAASKPAAALTLPPPRIIGSLTSLPELDSTQTIRALTSAELDDEQQEKWFAVQLAVSEQPVNLDAMPRLDIFEAYRLYSVATAGSGKIVHSLRLGFFKEAVSAEAVSGYLKTFFGSPTVVRVSVAEHARFKDPPSRKPAAPAHEAKVVELNNARAGRPVPTVTMEVAAPVIDTAATGSFKMNATGSHRALSPTKSAAKPPSTSTKRMTTNRARTAATGRHKMAPAVKKSLAEQLLDEAREVELSESGIRKLPKNDSLLSRLVGKLTK
jgi:hypothetical protein